MTFWEILKSTNSVALITIMYGEIPLVNEHIFIYIEPIEIDSKT